MFGAIETPRLILDKGRLEKNAKDILDHAAKNNILLRPHLKTSKSIDVAKIATGGRLSSITVSTLKEAEYFARAGFRDILYAVGIAPLKLPHVKRIIQEYDGDILLITDNVAAAWAAAAFAEAENCPLQMLIEVDCGEHRGGVTMDSEELMDIAHILYESPAIKFKGIMSHAGHSYSTKNIDEIRQIAEQERGAALHAANRLRQQGITSEIISVGSTPTILHAETSEGLTEGRCGVYLFYDLAQFSRQICELDQIALSVLSTVIGHNLQGRSIIIDAGALALSKDIGANNFLADAGYGYVCDATSMERLGDLSVDGVHQEHGSISIADQSWFERLPIGSMVRILPNHACMTAAAYPDYLVVDRGEIIGEWPRVNGW